MQAVGGGISGKELDGRHLKSHPAGGHLTGKPSLSYRASSPSLATLLSVSCLQPALHWLLTAALPSPAHMSSYSLDSIQPKFNTSR